MRTAAQETAFQIALRNCSEEVRGELGYIGVFQQRASSPERQKDRISQVKEFSAFLCKGRCKSRGSLKSFLWYAPQLSGASILCFHILSFLRAHRWEWLLMAARWQVFFPSWVSSELTSSRGRAAIADDCDILRLLIWQEIFHFSVVMHFKQFLKRKRNSMTAAAAVDYDVHNEDSIL